MTTSTPQTLLVTGASGHLGQLVIEYLLAANAGHIIAATRSPNKLADLAARGVEVRYANFDDPQSLATAFAGANRLLMISTDGVNRTEQQQNAITAAEHAGVSHVVYTSITRASPESTAVAAESHYATEQALAASSLDWTVLRNNLYTDMFLGSLPRAVASGSLVAATGQGGAAYVTRDDCARAAAAALASNSTGRTILEISGPEVVTYTELAALLSELTGETVTYLPVDEEAIVEGMVAAGLPKGLAHFYVTFDTAIAKGELALVSSAVADLTGRQPESVKSFLTAHRDALVQGA